MNVEKGTYPEPSIGARWAGIVYRTIDSSFSPFDGPASRDFATDLKPKRPGNLGKAHNYFSPK